MNKAVSLLLILVVLFGGWWLLSQGSEEGEEIAPAVTEVEVVETDEVRTTPTSAQEEEPTDDTNVVVIPLSGRNFAFSGDTITVKQGDTIRIDFISEEGFHDWVVDEFDAATERVSAGETTSVEFVADQVGAFEYYCSVGNHRAQGMVGTLIVE